MLKKVISLFIIFIFLFTEITVDFHYLKDIPFSVTRAYADTATPYCLPTNDGTKTGTFFQEIGYCVLDPEDPAGKCLSPYVYSVEHKKCVTTPLCPGLYVWNSQTKQCESVSASPSGGTEPTFPENSCAVDANGNGEVEQNEIFQCQQTPQGYICPAGQTQCNPQYEQPTCPDQYTYNPQTQKCEYTPQAGVCSSQQVPVTQYQCPVNGQIYSDLNQCNSACIQTAQCNATQTPLTGFAYEQFIGTPDEWTCSYTTGYWQKSSCSNGLFWYIDYQTVYGQTRNNRLMIYNPSAWWIDNCLNSSCTASCVICAIAPPPGVGVSGSFYSGSNNCSMRIWAVNSGSNTTMNFSGCGGGGSFTFTNANAQGDFTISFNNGRVQLTIVNNCLRFYETRFGGSGQICFYRETVTCPLPGGSACSGNPPTCTAGQACVTYDSTVTKWQCSLNGTQYDTQDQCTTSCYSGCPSGGTFNPSTGKCEATATCQTGTLQAEGCFTGYGCPLGQYQCHNINNTWVCSPHQCITSSQLQDEGDVIPSGYEDDGERDEQGNCLGTIYIFNGKGMRCRKSGVQTGFHNCCNESQGKLYDSTGSVGGGIGALTDVAKAMAAVYTVVNFGRTLANTGIVTIDVAKGTITAFTSSGSVTYSLTSAEGKALLDTTLAKGSFMNGTPGSSAAYSMPIGNDEVVKMGMQQYIENLGPQIAAAIAQLAVSQMVKDPVLSSAINLVITAIFVPSPVGIAFGVVNLAMALFQKRCDKQDIMTSTFKESGYCHEVGEYCIKKWPLVGCVQKAKGFCCFNSKLARIIHEQGRPQLVGFGVDSWGNPKNPNCRGFLPEEFQALDFNKIDLSEYIEDIQRNIRQNLAPQLQQQIQQSWGW